MAEGSPPEHLPPDIELQCEGSKTKPPPPPTPEKLLCKGTGKLMTDPVWVYGDPKDHIFDRSFVEDVRNKNNGAWQYPPGSKINKQPDIIVMKSLKKQIDTFHELKEQNAKNYDKLEKHIAKLEERGYTEQLGWVSRIIRSVWDALTGLNDKLKIGELTEEDKKSFLDCLDNCWRKDCHNKIDDTWDEVKKKAEKAQTDDDLDRIRKEAGWLKSMWDAFNNFLSSLGRIITEYWPVLLAGGGIGTLIGGAVAGVPGAILGCSIGAIGSAALIKASVSESSWTK